MRTRDRHNPACTYRPEFHDMNGHILLKIIVEEREKLHVKKDFVQKKKNQRRQMKRQDLSNYMYEGGSDTTVYYKCNQH